MVKKYLAFLYSFFFLPYNFSNYFSINKILKQNKNNNNFNNGFHLKQNKNKTKKQKNDLHHDFKM